MAKIECEGKTEEVEDGDEIVEACKSCGISFGCESGICGTCRVKVEEGMENLTEKTQEEEDFGLGEGERLACQCKIKKGSVKLKSVF